MIDLDSIGGPNDSLAITIPKLNGSGYTMETIRVKYKWRPPRCDECKVFGHSCENCPKKPKAGNKQPTNGQQRDGQDDGSKRSTNTSFMPKRDINVTNRNSFAALSDDVTDRKKSGKDNDVSEEDREVDESSNETLSVTLHEIKSSNCFIDTYLDIIYVDTIDNMLVRLASNQDEGAVPWLNYKLMRR
uniref:Zinc knuckle CX2CX4HX4C n=1 Tax=Tanacetum cinerariifolium TaxID=118510 RepID=A0A6L2MFT3_TANCI|nr:hypothetical protein [Tanacetum cinerariifolium]